MKMKMKNYRLLVKVMKSIQIGLHSDEYPIETELRETPFQTIEITLVFKDEVKK